MKPSPGRGSVLMYGASALLGLAILIGLALLLILIIRPPQPLTVAIGQLQATECPAGSGAPACFQFDVTNTGERNGTARCTVTPASETAATFINGSRSVEAPLAAGEAQRFYVKVTPTGQGDTVYEPVISCKAA